MRAPSAQLPSIPADGTAVVAGASGAIGRAVADRLHASGRFAAVHRFARKSNPSLDVTDNASIAAAAETVNTTGHRLRLFIDCTGFLHDDAHGGPDKSFRHIDPAHMAHAFAVNATGPALLMKHFLPLLPRDGKAVFATLSAKVGSIGDNQFGGWYSYRASKAALNQIVRSAAIELGRRRSEAICVAIHPGTTESALSAPFSKSGLTVREPKETAGRILSVIDGLGPADSGTLLHHDGTALPW